VRGRVGVEAPPPIREEPEEEATAFLVAQMMRALADRQQSEPTWPRVVMRGGTAAKLAYGLTRPSKDIDIDIVGSPDGLDIWSLIEEAAEHAGLVALATRHRRSHLKGTLQLSDRRTPSLTIDVDARLIHDPADARAIRDQQATVLRNGILTYRPEILAQQKLALAALPTPRLRPKDRYDIAWWLTERIADVPAALRTTLDATLRERPEACREWDRKHELDTVTRRIHAMPVQQALTSALDHDPAVLVARIPGSSLVLEVGRNAGGMLRWLRRADDPKPRLLGRFDNDQDVQTYMTAYGLWRERDVPERLRDLQAERARARQQTR